MNHTTLFPYKAMNRLKINLSLAAHRLVCGCADLKREIYMTQQKTAMQYEMQFSQTQFHLCISASHMLKIGHNSFSPLAKRIRVQGTAQQTDRSWQQWNECYRDLSFSRFLSRIYSSLTGTRLPFVNTAMSFTWMG